MKLEIYEVATRLGREYGVPPAHVAAIIEVESNGVIYGPSGFPVVRWEGHYFDRLLSGTKRDEARRLGLANPRAGAVRNPNGQAARHALFERAARIDRDAAIMSMSWGVGQVMGSHWKALGYASPEALRLEAFSGLDGQSRLMMRYVVTFGLLDELQAGEWTAFARGYNGPGYRTNRYDEKMADAAARHGGRVAPTDGMLRLGAKGGRVRELQRLLIRAGTSLVADGDFGPATRDAVRHFQRINGLAVDGVAGPETMAALAAFKTTPEETLDAPKVTDLPEVQKAAAPVAGATVVVGLKDSIEAAAAQVGQLAGVSSAFETAATGLVAIAGLVGIVAAGWAAWEWIESRRTYEGVRT